MNIADFERTLEEYRNATPAVRDAHLEQDALELLAKLEHRLTQWDGVSEHKRIASRFETTREMLLDLIEFINSQFGNDALVDDLSAICELRDRMKALEETVARRSFGGLFSLKSSEDDGRQLAFRRLGDQALTLFARLLDYPSSRFHEPQKIEEWRQTYVGFLEEMQKRW